MLYAYVKKAGTCGKRKIRHKVFEIMLIENQPVDVRRSKRHILLSDDFNGDAEVRSAFESHERIPGFDDLPARFGEFTRGSVIQVYKVFFFFRSNNV